VLRPIQQDLQAQSLYQTVELASSFASTADIMSEIVRWAWGREEEGG
jgi:hypothetical protein